MKSIPISKIDYHIDFIKKSNTALGETDSRRYAMGILLDLKKESEEMIPLSAVEARIKELENTINDERISEYWRENRTSVLLTLLDLINPPGLIKDKATKERKA